VDEKRRCIEMARPEEDSISVEVLPGGVGCLCGQHVQRLRVSAPRDRRILSTCLQVDLNTPKWPTKLKLANDVTK
jgi:hypothetical protein